MKTYFFERVRSIKPTAITAVDGKQGVFHVQGSDPAPYVVDLALSTCTCQAFIKQPKQDCKHLVAVRLARDPVRIEDMHATYVRLVHDGIIPAELQNLAAASADPATMVDEERIRIAKVVADATTTAIKAILRDTKYRQPSSRGIGGEVTEYVSLATAAGITTDVENMCESSERESYGDSYTSYSSGNNLSIYLRVRPTWLLDVKAAGIAVVESLLTLDAKPIEAPAGFTAWSAAWVKQAIGLSQVKVTGVIVRRDDGVAVHAGTVAAGVRKFAKPLVTAEQKAEAKLHAAIREAIPDADITPLIAGCKKWGVTKFSGVEDHVLLAARFPHLIPIAARCLSRPSHWLSRGLWECADYVWDGVTDPKDWLTARRVGWYPDGQGGHRYGYRYPKIAEAMTPAAPEIIAKMAALRKEFGVVQTPEAQPTSVVA